ncbi:hypothetical protein WBG83_07250 [Paenibacillus sp. y28]
MNHSQAWMKTMKRMDGSPSDWHSAARKRFHYYSPNGMKRPLTGGLLDATPPAAARLKQPPSFCERREFQ